MRDETIFTPTMQAAATSESEAATRARGFGAAGKPVELLFHWGWLLFFAGLPFIEWSALGLLLVLAHWAMARPQPVLRTPQLYRLAVFGTLTAYALSIIPAVNRLEAFGESVGFGLLLLFGMTYALRLETHEPGWWQHYVWPVPLAGVAAAGVGLYQYVFIASFRGRMMGVHSNPNVYSTALLIGLFVGAAALWRYNDWRRWLIPPYGAVMIAALLTTGSRGAWVGVLAGVAVFTLLVVANYWRIRPGRAVFLGVGAVLVGVLTVWLVYSNVSPTTQARMASVVDIEANQDRVRLFGTMVNMIKSNPWLGVGMGNIEHRFAEFRVDERMQVFGTAHNYALQVLGETGVIGGLFALLLLFVWFRLGWPDPRESVPLLLLYSLLAAMFVRDLFDNTMTNFYVFFLANWLGGTLVGARTALREVASNDGQSVE